MKVNTSTRFSIKHLILMALLGLLVGSFGASVIFSLLLPTADSSDPMSKDSISAQPSNMGIELDRDGSEGHEDFQHGQTTPPNSTDSDLKQAWQALLNDKVDNRSQVEQFLEISRQWFARDGITILQEVDSSLQRNWELRNVLLRSLTERIPKNEYPDAFEVALQESNGTSSVLLQTIAASWISKDRHAALARLDGIQSSQVRAGLFNSILSDWSIRDPESLLSNVEGLPQNFQRRAKELALQSIAWKDPKIALTHLASLENTTSLALVASVIATSWASDDPYAALNWVQTDESVTSVKHNLLATVLGSVARTDPDFAMDVALDHPNTNGQWGLDQVVINAVTWHNPEKGREFLSKMRTNEYTDSVYAQVGASFIRHGKSDDALALAAELSGSQRTRYLHRIVDTWSSLEPETLFHSLPNLPSEQLRSRAAFNLIRSNVWTRSLSNDQIYSLWGRLTEEQIATLKSQGKTQADFLN